MAIIRRSPSHKFEAENKVSDLSFSEQCEEKGPIAFEVRPDPELIIKFPFLVLYKIAVSVQPSQPKQHQQLEQLPQLAPQPIAESSSMEYYSSPAGTGPPERDAKYTKLHCPFHRINVLSQEPHRLVGNNVKFYPIENNGRVLPGCSGFIPLKFKQRTQYSESTVTRWSSGLQYSWHFNIFPTKSMTLPEYSNMIKNLDWKLCNIKEAASPDKLPESLTLEIYRDDILRELENRFMWKESDHKDYHIEDDCKELTSEFEEGLKIDDRPSTINSIL
ncbi:hypothetical protein GLOIN_2v961068 [Rhizophagus clarus]|uniref:Uncharacterized protein n=1 Tax=Rhizophagus clarus TaxID=94130 RepID=A0A8H3L1P8_9GLOM|nr:hypothetical protein GLOIN_2v961068 [Rhizophagus clarus]